MKTTRQMRYTYHYRTSPKMSTILRQRIAQILVFMLVAISTADGASDAVRSVIKLATTKAKVSTVLYNGDVVDGV